MSLALVVSEMPRERCLLSGARSLSLRECLALLIGAGCAGKSALQIAESLLHSPGQGLSPEDELRAFFDGISSAPELLVRSVPGLGPAKRASLLAAFELARRYSMDRSERQRQASLQTSTRLSLSSRVVDRVSSELRSDPREWLGFVPIYAGGSPGGLCVVERGVRTHVNTDPTELFARLLPLRPKGLYLFHNHPSGSLKPSEQDRHLTRQVRDLCSRFGIEFLGHAIVTAESEHWVEC